MLPRYCLRLIALSLLLGTTALAYDFVYVSDSETTAEGEQISWSAADSVIGTLYTNDCFFCVDGPPTVDGFVLMGCAQPTCIFGETPTDLNVQPYPFEDDIVEIRDGAAVQGHWFGDGYWSEHYQYCLSIRSSNMMLFAWERGTPFDSTMTVMLMWSISFIDPYTFIYVDAPLRVYGQLNANGSSLIVGCSEDISIGGNIILTGTNLENGDLPENAQAKIALVAEGSIIIRNTWENGRANSAQDSDVVVTAVLISQSEEAGLCLGQPNDPSDSYICPCSPDLRGVFRLNGALIQRRRGQWYNDNNGGTGYRAVFKFDSRLIGWSVAGWDELGPFIEPRTLDFGEVPVGESRLDSVTIRSFNRFIYSGAFCSSPFAAPADYQFTDTVTIPITFSPPNSFDYSCELGFFLDGRYRTVTLRGRGIDPPGAAASVSVAPNPFNPITTIRLSLSQNQPVALDVYNIAGQLVQTLVNENLPAGEHNFTFDGSALASGVYFIALRAGEMHQVEKIVLLR